MLNTLSRRCAPVSRGACVGLSVLALIAAAGCGSGQGRTAEKLSRQGVMIQGVVAQPPAPYAVIDAKQVPVPQIAMGDPATVRRILEEGTMRNQVVNHHRYLTTQIGARLTGSSNAEKANRWAKEQFESWGLNAELNQWGEIPVRFDRGPSTGKLYTKEQPRRPRRGSEESAPTESKPEEPKWRSVRDFNFTTLAWTSGTSGPKRGKVVLMPETKEEYERVKPQLAGAWILLKPMSIDGRGGVRGPGQMAGERFNERKEARDKVAKGEDPSTFDVDTRVIFDGIHGFITAATDQRDRVWTTAVPKWRERQLSDIPPDVEVIVRQSDYDNMRTRLVENQEFEVEFDLQNTLIAGPIPVYNTIAEIRGTEKPDEVVIVCGHLDSWNGPGSQGSLDNGTGSAVTMEAARILAAAGARPKRTIRFCLWTGEEQGLLGARAYVKQIGEQAQKISAVLNDDGGTNYQGGLKCTADMADYLAAATAPVNGVFYDTADAKPMQVNIQIQDKFPRMASSDHFAFVEVGAPGFFWDEVGRSDYGYGWHTQHDKFELAIPEYLMQSATCAAVTAYNLASAPELLPRVPKPEPTEREQDRDENRQRNRETEQTPAPNSRPSDFGVNTR